MSLNNAQLQEQQNIEDETELLTVLGWGWIFCIINMIVMFILCVVFSCLMSSWFQKSSALPNIRNSKWGNAKDLHNPMLEQLKGINDSQIASWVFFHTPVIGWIPMGFFISRMKSLWRATGSLAQKVPAQIIQPQSVATTY